MDLTNPLRTLSPTVDGDVLAVLARTHAPLTGARVQRLAGRSYAQVRHALHRLTDHGLVDSQRHGQAVSYSLNRQHVLAGVVEAAVASDSEAEQRLRAVLQEWPIPAIAAILFGSFARRDGDSESDIDLLLVRGEHVTEDDGAWATQRYDLTAQLERWTGNTVQIVDLDQAEFRAAVSRGDDLISSLRRDGRVVAGPGLSVLLRPDEGGEA